MKYHYLLLLLFIIFCFNNNIFAQTTTDKPDNNKEFWEHRTKIERIMLASGFQQGIFYACMRMTKTTDEFKNCVDRIGIADASLIADITTDIYKDSSNSMIIPAKLFPLADIKLKGFDIEEQLKILRNASYKK